MAEHKNDEMWYVYNLFDSGKFAALCPCLVSLFVNPALGLNRHMQIYEITNSILIS